MSASFIVDYKYAGNRCLAPEFSNGRIEDQNTFTEKKVIFTVVIYEINSYRHCDRKLKS